MQGAEQKALTAERRVVKLQERVRTAEAAATRARMALEQAKGLLRESSGGQRTAQLLRDDPDALVALVADERRLLDWYRNRVRELEHEVRALTRALGNR